MLEVEVVLPQTMECYWPACREHHIHSGVARRLLFSHPSLTTGPLDHDRPSAVMRPQRQTHGVSVLR